MSEKWIVAFMDLGRVGWWDIFTRPGFRHVMALHYEPTLRLWYSVDWGRRGLTVKAFSRYQMQDAIAYMIEYGTCFEVVKQPNSEVSPVVGLYCVSAVKSIIGLRCWWAVTPWLLACALRRYGARPIFRKIVEDPDGHSQRAEAN